MLIVAPLIALVVYLFVSRAMRSLERAMDPKDSVELDNEE